MHEVEVLVAQQGIGGPGAANGFTPQVDHTPLLFERGHRKVGAAERIDDDRSTAEPQPVLEAHTVDVHDPRGLQLRGDGQQLVPHANAGDSASCTGPPRRAAADHEKELGAVLRQQPGGRRVPGVFADQDAEPAETGVERAQGFAGAEVAGLVEHAVGRQVDLALHVNDLAAGQVRRRVAEPVARHLDRPALVDSLEARRTRPDPCSPHASFRNAGPSARSATSGTWSRSR